MIQRPRQGFESRRRSDLSRASRGQARVAHRLARKRYGPRVTGGFWRTSDADTIAMVDELPTIDAEMGEALVTQAFAFWIGPEIERRHEAGELPEDFALTGAQVIFGLD